MAFRDHHYSVARGDGEACAVEFDHAASDRQVVVD